MLRKKRKGAAAKRNKVIKEKKKAATKAVHYPQDIRRDKPLTSEDELKRTRQEINATNRRRAKDMERRIARYLRGTRVPSSGAMMGMKGDCYIPLLTSGQYMIECKLSANRNGTDDSKIVLNLGWFDKLIKDSNAMRTKFGVLVIHYHGLHEDYVFVPSNGLQYIASQSLYRETLEMIQSNAFISPRDLSTINNRKRAVFGLYRSVLLDALTKVNGFEAAAFTFSSGVWYVIPLSQFRDLMEGV